MEQIIESRFACFRYNQASNPFIKTKFIILNPKNLICS